MKYKPQNLEPIYAQDRLGKTAVVCYPIDSLPPADMGCYQKARDDIILIDEIIIPPREAKTFHVPAGHFFRIVSTEGPQVGDLNLWHKGNLNERFYSGKTRALYGTHVSTGDR
ncbi:MAG: urea carboxylase-associated family protein, partial [Gammaproteobacteria bacterium]|nr:urea carboxylase-associated family protein [Gammaproteobacteria bacterium]